MPTAARPLEMPSVADPFAASVRHRGAAIESFPSADYDAREAAYLRALLTEPLLKIALAAADDQAREIAKRALGLTTSEDLLVDLAHLEDALEQIASTATNANARGLAEDALALYRGR